MILPNPLRTHKTLAEKQIAYNRDCATGTLAWCDGNKSVQLTSVPVERVEFIGGLWRVQNETDYHISMIRDCELIVGPKLDYTENTFFTYYKAMAPNFNCYGLICSHFDMVIARYDTDAGPQYGYGRSIPAARAFLGIRLYDEHKDLIHSVVCKHTRTQQK